MPPEQHGLEPPLPYLNELDLTVLLREHDIWTPAIQQALMQAQSSHEHQLRDNGRPYLQEHIYPVAAEVVYAYGYDRHESAPETAVIAALLHDAPEDDSAFTLQLCNELFGAEVARIVSLLTKAPEDNDPNLPEAQKRVINQRMLERIAHSPSDTEKYVKLADRTKNAQSTPSISLSNPQKFERYLAETRDLYLPFALGFSPYFYRQLEALVAELTAYKDHLDV